MSGKRNSEVNQDKNNDNKLTRINKNIDSGNRNLLDVNRDTFKKVKPRNKEELSALDLAEALNDYQNLPLYRSYSKKYPESFLRKILGGQTRKS